MFPAHHRIDAERAALPESGEEGYMLLAMVVMAALVLIGLSVAAPVVARDLRRDKEVESEHRAEEYVRAIQLFYRKNHGYPPSIKALEGTNNVRYLRQQYVDPLTGESNWRLIHLGEQKTTIKGFFGQELAGIPSGGLGSAAGMQSSIPGASGAASSSTTTIGATSALASGFSGASITTATAGAAGASGATGALGSTGSSGSAGMFGDSAGGGVIVGVGTAKTGDSILQPNGQTTYETWEFWYDPRIEALKKNSNILGGGIASQPASGFGSDATSGQPNGAAGSTGATGSSGTTTPSAPTGPLTTPQ